MHFSIEESLDSISKERLQLDRLKLLVENLYSKSKFYKSKFDELNIKPSDINSLDDIQKLTFTTKKDLIDNYPNKLLLVDTSDIDSIHSSSGSGGIATMTYYTKKDMQIWSEVMARSYYLANVNSDDIIQNAYHYGLFTGGLGFHHGADRIGATIIPTSSGNTLRQIQLLKDLDSTVLTCTPSYALHMANIAKNNDKNYLNNSSLKIGIFGAEPASIELKNKISKIWNIKYHNIYGLSEIIGPGVACSCSDSINLHIQDDHFYPEIIDPNTEKVLEDGKRGELVLTTLTREAMPLLRYKTGDITSIVSHNCACGRTTKMIEPILSRVDEVININGVNIYPSQIEYVFDKIDELSSEFEIIINNNNYLNSLDISVEVEISTNISKKLKEKVEYMLKEYLLINTNITLLLPNSIKRDSVKRKRVIQIN
jgi:phenylacetate-CoA ligase